VAPVDDRGRDPRRLRPAPAGIRPLRARRRCPLPGALGLADRDERDPRRDEIRLGLRALRTRNRYSATSADQLPHQLASYFMLGHQFLFPIPENGLERRLWRIEAPTLIVWGEQDRFISPIYADIFREKIANAEVVRIPDTGHLIGLESPESLAEALARWGQVEQ